MNWSPGVLSLHPFPLADSFVWSHQVLTHAKDITKAYGGAPVTDAVLIIPSFYTQPERQALLDSAEVRERKDERTENKLVAGRRGGVGSRTAGATGRKGKT